MSVEIVIDEISEDMIEKWDKAEKEWADKAVDEILKEMGIEL